MSNKIIGFLSALKKNYLPTTFWQKPTHPEKGVFKDFLLWALPQLAGIHPPHIIQQPPP